MTRPPRPLRHYALTLVLLAAGLVSALGLHWDFSALSSWTALARSWARFAEFLTAFGAPDLSHEALVTAAQLALDTLCVALLGVGLGLLLAYPLAMGASRCVVLGSDRAPWPGRWLRRAWLEAHRLVLDVLRGVPDFAWALMLANFTGIGTPTGVLAIGLSVAGILGKILSEQWDNLDPQGYAALRSTGASRLQLFFYGVQPLAARSMLSFVLMRTECAIRNASVIGVIAGGGLGSGLWDAFKDSRYDYVVTLLAAMLVLTASADLLANLLRYQLRVDAHQAHHRRPHSRTSSLVRRAIGVGACLALGLGSFAWQWPAIANLADEFSRLEPDFAFGFLRRLLTEPDLTAIPVAARESFVPLAVAMLTTLSATALAGLLAYPASVALQLHPSDFTGERISRPRRALRGLGLVLTRAFGLLCRGVPEVAWVLILGAFFRQGLLAGVLAVTLHSSGVLLRVFAESLDNVPYRRFEQVAAASRPQLFLYAGLPSAWPDWRTYSFFQFEVNMRMGIVLGMVGAGGLGEAFDGNLKFDRLERASTFLWSMVLLTVLVDRLSRWLQMRRLRC